MSAKVYPAEKVDPLLKAASEAMHGIKDYAAGLEAKNAQLTQELEVAKQAASEKVELEKVAAAKTAPPTSAKVADFVDMLVDRAIIPENSREKYASACLSSTDAALDIATQALKLSESPVEQGRGIKAASAGPVKPEDQERLEEDALWNRAASSGKWD